MKEFIFKGKVKDLKKAMKLFELLRCRRYGIEKGIDTSYIDYKIHNLFYELQMKDIVLK